jgi:hypothetical protein
MKSDTDNDHQKTVSGQKQHGPKDKIDHDAGGNEGSKGQNFSPGRGGTDRDPKDQGDERHGGGSGGGQGNRQNRAVNDGDTGGH